MGFQSSKFMASKLVPRTAEVTLPSLKDWFDDGEDPKFKVRGLTSTELARANEALDKTEQIKAIVEAITTSNKRAQGKAMRDALGLDGVPNDIAKRITMLKYGAVEPELEERVAVKLAETFPIEFYMLTNKITELTGMGSFVEGKSRPSGKKQESDSPAILENSEEPSSLS